MAGHLILLSCSAFPIAPSDSMLSHPYSSLSSDCLQALAQELNFSAYLGLPVFMIPLNGSNNANLARLLLNHIHTGHHTSNVRRTTPKSSTHTQSLLLDSGEVRQPQSLTNCCCPLCLISSGYVSPCWRRRTRGKIWLRMKRMLVSTMQVLMRRPGAG